MHHYTTKDYLPVIEWFYHAESPAFYTSYHKCRGGTVAACVADTAASISPQADFFVVEEHGTMAAFFVRTFEQGVGVLEGFHILPAFRTPLFVERFWEVVRRAFGTDIHIGISADNEPARKHLLRNGFRALCTVESGDKTFILLSNKLSDTCH